MKYTSRHLDFRKLLIRLIPNIMRLQQIEGTLCQSLFELPSCKACLSLEEIINEASCELFLDLIINLQVVRNVLENVNFRL